MSKIGKTEVEYVTLVEKCKNKIINKVDREPLMVLVGFFGSATIFYFIRNIIGLYLLCVLITFIAFVFGQMIMEVEIK
jgi:hypothetical protein